MRNYNVVKVYDHRVTEKHEFVKADIHRVFSVTYIGVQLFKDKEEGIWRQLGSGGFDYQLSEDIDGLLMSQEAQAALNALNTSKVEKAVDPMPCVVAQGSVGHCGMDGGACAAS